MKAWALRALYEVLSRIGANPSLTAADIPDNWLVEHVEGERQASAGPGARPRLRRGTQQPLPRPARRMTNLVFPSPVDLNGTSGCTMRV